MMLPDAHLTPPGDWRALSDLVVTLLRSPDRLAAAPGVRILNEVVLNQVLVRFEPRQGDAGAFTKAVVTRVQREGTCWMAGTRWHDLDAMRISISNWSTTEEDIDRSAQAILACARAEAGGV